MDQDEFTAFYRETAPALRGYIRRVSGDGQAADDLLQETYLRFLRAKPAVDDRAAMKAYLYKTATAAIYDRWRKQQARAAMVAGVPVPRRGAARRRERRCDALLPKTETARAGAAVAGVRGRIRA
jgi:DNA-directed RNA polymerase specialized sigma24 family protein